MKFGVVVFPGSNCDYDSYQAIKTLDLGEVVYLWHGDKSVNDCDVVILPGGFSYGDYLRSGAIARFSPIMRAVIKFAESGGLVIGICNGFQVLLEAGLLPGAMRKNLGMRFVCKDVYLKVQNYGSRFTRNCPQNKALKIPIAHAEGNYYVNKDVLDELVETNRIIFQYCDKDGNVTEDANPNGALVNIAGVINREGNVLGMMPHPERACELFLGSDDGQFIFNSITGSVV
jgi:phosphoribosylformylglycinamidine synthase I